MRTRLLHHGLRTLSRQQYLSITRRSFAKVRDSNPLISFTPSIPQLQQPVLHDQHKNNTQPDERTLKLGKSKMQRIPPAIFTPHCFTLQFTEEDANPRDTALQILQPRLPNLLASPLPQEILSPQISLHLFPSTHPHLPTVTGRVAYHAALWTSPITWGKIPLVGNVNLEILSERMVRLQPQHASVHSAGRNRSRASNGGEKLIVRWRTVGKTKGLGIGGGYKGIGAGQSVDKITAWLGGDEKRDDREFCGKFIFAFDDEGRILDHVIERAEEGWDAEQWENGFGRVVGLTDWLLGRIGGRDKETPGVALGCVNQPTRGARESRR